MSCRHPRAARAIRVTKTGELVTVCWACEVEADIVTREAARVIEQRAYWRDAQRRSRARKAA